ncbi:hypothetical protein [Alkalibacterium thalassium]|uniref:Uncharacterized protein n=1 Tax=Alkalibacterium thalassium TaxID=426701 RepID=A0A1G8VSP6_9LACT|nr:hypothetical protein [Alkalibacterium thalassium]SDJ68465.1 hypothetical protein SAMN04488098_100268 [Alkalibacterium thalassium]
MNKEDIDREAERYKQFESSFRRIMAVRNRVEEELTNRTHPPDENIQTFPKSSERIARMIREEDGISD